MDNKTAKVSLGTTICVIIIILLVVALCGMYYYYNNMINKNSIDSTADIISTTDNDAKKESIVNNKITKIDTNKELVYKVKTSVKEYDQEVEVPQINLNYDNIKALNDKIIKYTNNWSMGGVESKYYINDDIISIVLTYSTEGDPYNIFIYNIDAYTGNILTNEELLYKKGITDNLEEKINKAVEKVFKEHNVQDYDDEVGTWTRMSEICNDYNRGLQITMPMFINENGKLSVVVEYCAPAGSGGPWGVIVEL